MGKGIIANKPMSGNPHGKLIVIEGSIDPTQPTDPGTVLKFDGDINANDGDVVDFDIDPATGMPVNINQATPGRVITGSTVEDITVAQGESVLLTSANVEGSFTVSGGYLTVVANSTISGTVVSKAAGSYIYMVGASVDGKLESSNGGYLSVVNSNITGKIVSSSNKFVSIQSSTVFGKLEVTNAGTTKCSGNTLNGKPIPGC